jgi:hypothetical protein
LYKRNAFIVALKPIIAMKLTMLKRGCHHFTKTALPGSVAIMTGMNRTPNSSVVNRLRLRSNKTTATYDDVQTTAYEGGSKPAR